MPLPRVRCEALRSFGAKIRRLYRFVLLQGCRRITEHDLAGLEHIATVRHYERHQGVLCD